ncbi:VWA domain-containing protein [Agromyces aureus]|uniref:VWA domain-containing protein n=1 Tax=Agromyces aureus TaxID=453304 RepID=UPI0012601884|nr:VWA domain-containing protein [Agromyces aureus]
MIASIAVGGLLVVGLPTMAFAEGVTPTDPPTEQPITTTETTPPTEAATPTEEATPTEAATPTEEATPTESATPTEEAAEPPAEEAPAAKQAAKESAAGDVGVFSVFPADTANCTTECGNLQITNTVSGGSATPDQWTIHAVRLSNSDNYNFTSGQTRSVPRNNTYTLYAENGPANYTTTGFTCSVGGSGGGDPTFNAANRTVTFSNSNGNPTQKFANCTFTQTFTGPGTINVQVGGVRTGISAVAGLAGVTLQLYTDNAGSFGSIINQPWATCVSLASGVCTFTVPAPNGARYWVAQATPGVPGGWTKNGTLATGTTPASAPYRFQTSVINNGGTYSSTSDFMIATGNTTNNASGGIWQNSLANPPASQKCGVRVALVIDLSGSVAPNFTELKNAAKGFVTALQGTPSQVGIFTFNNVAPASSGANLGITPVSTVAGANTVRNHIDGFSTPTEATNWDRGIYQVATSGTQYDLAVVLTDGNPTVYSNDEGPGNRTRFREVENGVFSANAVKALGTRVIGFGVGDGVGGSPDNLIAISGNTLNSDYFQSADYDEAGTILRNLALGACEGSISVVKQVVSSTSTGESKTGQTPAGGWKFTAAPTTGGITPASQEGTTAAGTGAVNLPLTFAGGTTSGTVNVTEDPQGHSIVQTSGKNAVCTDVATGAAITVGNLATGFSVPVSSTQAITCTVWNRPPLPQATYSVNKVWVVNGVTYQNGQQPIGLTAQLTVGGTNTPWVTVQGPVPANTVISLNETTGVGSRDLCRITDSKVTLANGAAPGNGALPYSATLQPGDNTYTITNTVTCDSQLTLKKTVTNGGVAPSVWNLDAVAPGGSLPGPNGATGTPGATALVTPNTTYPLVETGDPRYVQTLGLNAVPVPPATGSWNCEQVNAGGTVIPGFSDGLNGGVTVPLGFRVQCTAVNQTALLTLIKDVVELEGTDPDPSDWTLTATPNVAIPGLNPASTTTGNTVLVRPGTSYTISESGGPAGYQLRDIQCKTTAGGDYVVTSTVTVAALATGTCIVTNEPIAPQIKLTKVVTGNVAPANQWYLSATAGGTVVGGDGGTGGFVDVPAGVPLTLAESTSLPNAGEFLPGTWSCSKNGGAPVAGPSVPALAPGDKVDCTVTNTLKPIVPTITKTAAIPTANANGTWTIGYDIVVKNPSNFQDLTYTLSDQLKFGTSVTVNSATYQLQPAGAVTAWSVPFANVQAFAGVPTLLKATQQTWHVTVNATVAPNTVPSTDPAACKTGTPGNVGFLNSAVMTVAGTTYPAQDCAVPVNPTITKVGGTAVDNGDGTWTLPYTITVTNPSATTGVVYDLRDKLALPASVTQVGPPVVVSKPGGVTTVPTWTGAVPNDLLADDIALAGGAAAHVYQISVQVSIDSGDPAYTCPSAGGLNNTATLVSGNQTTDATGCVTVNSPTITHTKAVVPGSVSQGSDGKWTIAYDLVVKNTTAVGGLYTLADSLHFGTGVVLTGASYALTKDSVAYPTSWAGSGNIAVDAYLAGNTTTTYRITVSGIGLTGPDLTPAQSACPTGGSANAAFNNTSTLKVAGTSTDASACGFPSAPKIVKSGATSMQRLDDGTWDVSYTLTVSNTDPGAKPSYYTLTDDPAFPAGVDYLSYQIDAQAPVTPYDGSPFTVASNKAIAADAVDVYTVVINVDAPAGEIPPAELECKTDNNPGGVGFLNNAIVTSGEITRTDDDCTNIDRGGEPTVEKGNPTVTQDADGVWTIVYDVTVTGNEDFVSKYTLDDTLRFGPEVDVLSATWTGETSGEWPGPVGGPPTDETAKLVPTDKVIGIAGVHEYTVTVTAKVDKAAFTDPTTNTCAFTEVDPNVGFLNEATLTSNGISSSDTGCGLPAQPKIEKSSVGDVTKVGDHWEATYTVTVQNLSATQALVYDLSDTPDFAGDVSITDREVTSSDVTVNPAWNGASSSDDVVVEDQELLGGATHTFTVVVSFTVDDVDGSDELLCEGEDGKGLLNGATVTSGDTYTDDACFDVPVVVLLDKEWVIDGGAPIAWDSDDLPDGFSAQGTLDGQNVEWDTEYGPYALNDEVTVGETGVQVPENCELVDSSGTGDQTLENTFNTFLVTNYVDCTQTVTLTKVVQNPNGGDAVAADWTLSGENVGDDSDTFTGEGTASGTVDVNVGYTLNEVSTKWVNGVEYEVTATWTCESESGPDAFTLLSTPGSVNATLTVNTLGASVDCTITNSDIAPTLELEKIVKPDSVATDFPPSLWTLTASDNGTTVIEGDGAASGPVESNVSYDLAESADFEGSDEFESGEWVCFDNSQTPPVPVELDDDAVVLQPGQDVSCSITNTANPATYEVDKTVESAEQQADGSWLITYEVTVENTSVVSPLTYDLIDDLSSFGEGITIDEATWSSTNGDSGDWGDLPDTLEETLATDQPLEAGAEDVFTVIVSATVTEEAWTGETTVCSLPGSTEAGGFRNVATITINERPEVRTDCDEPGQATAVKSLFDGAQPTLNGDGTFTVKYKIEVTNESDKDLFYDLSDTPAFPAGTTFTATAVDPDGDPVGDWTGVDPDTVLADDWVIPAADGEPTVQTWVITATANVETITEIDDVKCVESTSGKGFFNGGSFSSGTIETDLEACVNIPVAKLTLTKHVDNTAIERLPITGGVASDWSLFADGPVLVDAVGNEDGVTTVVPVGEYGLWEQAIADPSSPLVPDYYDASAWECEPNEATEASSEEDPITHLIELAAGDDVTCTITNTVFAVDVGIEKRADLPEGVTAVDDTEDNEFEWVLTVTNNGRAVANLEVTDLIDPQLEITGPATFDPAENWTEDTEGNAFSATYSGVFAAGQVATIRIPVKVLPVEVEAPPAVGPDDPAPVLPPLNTEPIPNEACVAILGPDEELELSADVDLGPVADLLDLDETNDCAEAEVPVKRVDAGAYVRCIADVPWLYFDVQATENVTPGEITVTWTSADGTLTKVQTVPWDARNGRLLWPGAAVDADGIPYQFPGWRPITEEDLANPGSVVPGTRFLDLILDETVDTYPWRDTENGATITFSVNPSQSVLAVYPQALPTCAIDRPAELQIDKTASVTSTKAGGDYSYSLQVTSVGTGATNPTEVFDEIPANLRVDSITTAPAPAFPRWENCEVTGKDSSGYGGTLHCDLLGQLGPNFTSAPVIDLAVHVKEGTKVSTIENTGEVCWQTADDTEPVTECAEDTVPVTLLGGTAVTGFAGGPWVWGAAGLLVLGSLAVIWVTIRRRREAAAD